MGENNYQFDLGQKVQCAAGEVVVLGRTKFMCPESYLINIDDEFAWVPASELSPLPTTTD